MRDLEHLGQRAHGHPGRIGAWNRPVEVPEEVRGVTRSRERRPADPPQQRHLAGAQRVSLVEVVVADALGAEPERPLRGELHVGPAALRRDDQILILFQRAERLGELSLEGRPYAERRFPARRLPAVSLNLRRRGRGRCLDSLGVKG
jgi:hypothetical protein